MFIHKFVILSAVRTPPMGGRIPSKYMFKKKNIEMLIKWLIYATFFVPLIVVPSSFIFPFIVPKIVVFRSLTTLIITLYVLLLMINWEEYKPRFTPLSLAVLLFFTSFALSTFFGKDPYHSFWDNHERMLGLFTIFHYVANFYIASAVFKTWADWKKALNMFLIAGSLVMFVGIIQVFNPMFLLNQGGERVISTLGNAIYVGGYGLFLFFVSALLLLRSETNGSRYLYSGTALLALAGLFFSGTRGTMLGLMMGLGLAMLSYTFVLKDHPKVRKSFIGIMVVGVLTLGLLFANRTNESVRKIPAIGRLLSTSVTEITGGPRIIAWGVGMKAWKEQPIIGWGPNNFFYAFNANYNPRSFEYGYGETWFDNAHNVIVNTLAVQGIVGLITYLFIFVAAIYMLVLAYRRGQVEMHLLIIGSVFLIAHLLQNITVFENPTSYLYFMFWLALVNRNSQKERQVDKESKPVVEKSLSSTAASVAGLIALFVVFIFNIQPARANMKTLNALQAINSDPENSISVIDEALSFSSPHIDDIRSDISRSILMLGSNPNIKMDPAKKKELFDIAEEELLKDLELHPLDIRNHLSLAQLFQTEAIQSNDVLKMEKAQKYLDLALQRSPRRQQIIYNLAVVDLQLGMPDPAFRMLAQSIDDDPKIAEGYIRLAYAYNVTGQNKKAREVIALAEKNGVQFGPEDQGLIDSINSTSSAASK